MNNKTIFKWELIGFIFTVIIGSLLHFCFEWSGYYKPFAVFCAVNESVWEHLKLGFWPYLLFAVIEYFAFGRNIKNFCAAKMAGLYAIPIIITVVYYIYTSILGTHNLVIDIALFVLAVLAAYIFSYKILISSKDFSKYNNIACLMIIIAILAFSLLSYYPPKLGIFRDPRNNTFGIPKL